MAAWPTITDGVTRLGNALFTSIKAYIDDLVGGQGLPIGGATNDILKKTSGTNYDAAWTDAPTLDSLTLDTGAAEATGVAKLYWDTTDVTAALGLNANITYHLGAQELVRVSNRTGSAIAAGKAVYILGTHGDRPEIALADASAEATAATTLGITAESIANAAQGYVCVSGLLRNLNTNHLTEGALVWLSETAGDLTSTRPTQPAHGVFLGLCVKQGPGTSGILYVSVVNGQELNELHDVLISTVTAGDLLKRNAGNTLWVNAAPAALTKTDDTNVTLTLGGSSSTALVNAASITAGWTGTLAAARLNSNVVQAITNDTNVTGSIAAQTLTLNWAGQLGVARGGTGASTLTGYVKGAGTSALTASATIPNTDITGLGTMSTQAASSVAITGGSITGITDLAVADGGTGASTQQGALNALAGAVTSGQYLRGNGTNVTMSAIQAGDVPTLNQNTTGSAATLTTARTINGTSFNGSANITTASWGTARTITIGSTGKSVDGSGNASWTLSEIGAMSGGGYSANQNLNTSNGPTFADVYVNGWLYNNVSGKGLYNVATANHFYSDSGYWNVAYSGTQGIRFRNGHAGAILGYVYAETSGNFGLLHNGGGWSIQISPGGGITMHQAVTGGQFISSDWFRNTGTTGLYNNTYGRGIWESQAAGATYGNFTTYNTGHNGWSGWTIGSATSFMGRPGVRDFGLYDTSSGWHFYAYPSGTGLASTIGGSSPLSGYALRVEGSLYVNSSVVIGGNTAWHAGNMDAPNKSGTSYYQANTWLQFNGSYGCYWPSVSGWSTAPHLYPSTSQLYGTLEIQGQKNSYAGFSIRDDSNKRHYLIGESGNFGLLLNNAIIWALYYSSSGNNIGYGSSSTVGGYSHTFHGAAYFHNAVFINNTVTATGTKSFDITHPVAPTKRLRYACIEGPRADVLHRGVATVSSHAVLDLDTEAQLLPGTSAALMRDLQCQLTNLSDTFCQLRGRLDGTTLHIYTDNPEPITVAWLVLGERQDKEIKAAVGTDDDGRLISEYDTDPIIGQPIPGPPVAALQQE